MARGDPSKTSPQRAPLLDVTTGRGNVSPVRSQLRRKTHAVDFKTAGAKMEEFGELEFGSEVFASTGLTQKARAMQGTAATDFGTIDGFDETTIDE